MHRAQRHHSLCKLRAERIGANASSLHSLPLARRGQSLERNSNPTVLPRGEARQQISLSQPPKPDRRGAPIPRSPVVTRGPAHEDTPNHSPPHRSPHLRLMPSHSSKDGVGFYTNSTAPVGPWAHGRFPLIPYTIPRETPETEAISTLREKDLLCQQHRLTALNEIPNKITRAEKSIEFIHEVAHCEQCQHIAVYRYEYPHKAHYNPRDSTTHN